jgi:sugar-specific transcriptional regulator TrmB
MEGLVLAAFESVAETLSDFGLTMNQSKIYVATVQLGLGSVRQISVASKVAREEVYRMLPELEKLGLVERVLGKPIRFRAIPAEGALTVLIGHEEEKANERISLLKSKKEEVLRNIASIYGKRISEKGSDFVLISEKDAIIHETSSLINKAKKSIDIVSSNKKLARFVFVFADGLKKAQSRNVRIRIITEMPDDNHVVPMALEKYVPGNAFELRYANRLPSHFRIIDNSEAMITTSTEAQMAESPSLMTGNSSLVGLLQSYFEDLVHTSIKWTDVNFSAPERTKRFTGQLQPTEHAIFVYDSLETKHEVLFNHIQNALENGEAAVYVCSEESTDQIREAMKGFGINVEECEKRSALSILHYTDFYMIGGEFSIPRTLNLWHSLYSEAQQKGFKGLRVTGETACFFRHGLVKELMDYERVLQTSIDIPIVVICAYNSMLLNRDTNRTNAYMELTKAHGTVLFEDIEKKLGRIKMSES